MILELSKRHRYTVFQVIIMTSLQLTRGGIVRPLPRSFGFGMEGIENSYYSAPYALGMPYYPPYAYSQPGYYGPQQDAYIPGQVNPFSYPHRQSRSILNPSYYGNPLTERSTVQCPPHKSEFDSPAPAYSVPNSNQYSQQPLVESIETYFFYELPKTQHLELSKNASVNPDKESISNSSEVILPSHNGRRSAAVGNGNEYNVQLNYAGAMPLSAVRASSEAGYKRSSGSGINSGVPIYPFTSDRGSQISSSTPPERVISPYRLDDNQLGQSSSKYQQSSFSTISQRPKNVGSLPIAPPIVSPYSNRFLPSSSGQLSSNSPQFSSSSNHLVPPYPPNGLLGYPQGLYSMQDGYQLFEVQPFNQLKQTKGDPISQFTKPIKIVQDIGSAYVKEGVQYATSLLDNYNSGHRSYTPDGRTFHEISTYRDYLPRPHYNNEAYYDSGRRVVINPFGPEGLSR